MQNPIRTTAGSFVERSLRLVGALAMIQDIVSFIAYFESIRRRTLNYIHTIPFDQFEWQPAPTEYTCGDIVRHIAAAEQMYVGLIVTGRWQYPGHMRDPALTVEALLAAFEASHERAMKR